MSAYKIPFDLYKRLQKMTKNEFSRWLCTFFDKAFQEGYKQACSDVPDGSIIIDPSENVVIEWTYEEYKEMLLSIKGIGESKAEAIIDKIYEHYDNKNGEDNING